MSDTASFESNEKFAAVEKKINHIINRDEGIKTAYSELRNFYSIIGNDVKGAICKRLVRAMSDVKSFNDAYIKYKTPRKDKLLAAIEHDFNEHLDATPDINPQNTPALFQFLRELMPLFIQIKAHTAKLIKSEKKPKKKKPLQNQLFAADKLSRDIHELYNSLLHLAYFDQYTLTLIRSTVNRDHIKLLVQNMHTVIKQSFKTGRNEVLDINIFRVIELMTMRIKIRLGIYEACSLFETYGKILKTLPRQLVQQFNTRYMALRRDSSEKSIDELKSTDEYKEMTKKFITLKLKKFYNLMRLYQVNVNRLFLIEKHIQQSFDDYIGKTDTNDQILNKAALLDPLQNSLNKGHGKYMKIYTDLPRNEDLKKNSIRTLFSLVMQYYYNVLKDTYSPLSCREIAISSMKLVKPPKEQMLNATELSYLEGKGYKRNDAALRVYYKGLMSLISGEEEETAVVTPLIETRDEDPRRGKKSEMRQKTIDQFAADISPAEFDLLIQILEIIPRDQERIGTDLGKIYLESAEKYPTFLKQRVNRTERVEPTDSEKEKLRKIVTDKYERLMLKTIEYQSGKPSAVDYLKKVHDEEQAYTNAEKERQEMRAAYNISGLITQWKNETEKSVIGFLLGGEGTDRYKWLTRELSRGEVKEMSTHFNSEHLGEIEKHYKTLNENIGQDYLKLTKPHSKTEYILLYAARNLIGEFRNPAKSYPRSHERLTSISPK